MVLCKKLSLTSKFSSQHKKDKSMRIVGIILGIAIATVGGVIAYRALYLEPSSAVVLTETDVRELPNTARVIGGMALLVIGAALAFFAARRRSR